MTSEKAEQRHGAAPRSLVLWRPLSCHPASAEPVTVAGTNAVKCIVGRLAGWQVGRLAHLSRLVPTSDCSVIHRTYVSGVERGRRNPTVAVVEKLVTPSEVKNEDNVELRGA